MMLIEYRLLFYFFRLPCFSIDYWLIFLGMERISLHKIKKLQPYRIQKCVG